MHSIAIYGVPLEGGREDFHNQSCMSRITYFVGLEYVVTAYTEAGQVSANVTTQIEG